MRRYLPSLETGEALDRPTCEPCVFLEELGWRVMRFWNSDGVAEAILVAVSEGMRPTPGPSLCPGRGGSIEPVSGAGSADAGLSPLPGNRERSGVG